MQNERGSVNNPIVPPILPVDPDEIKEKRMEDEKQAEAVPEDFESFNLDAVDDLNKDDNE
ncbi:hypothetical protein [Jeotgalibaca caeni]|uniref:hypothetical protein n=1 Tax=Jeotgalibaca caeni TaxID=3028623 RepID=UPI00237EB2BD|nr:hypothetical protein [Jeotgalibaca caeni]MDE1549551.1 hypothetical protein [Jeotgalibaca caeni]